MAAAAARRHGKGWRGQQGSAKRVCLHSQPKIPGCSAWWRFQGTRSVGATYANQSALALLCFAKCNACAGPPGGGGGGCGLGASGKFIPPYLRKAIEAQNGGGNGGGEGEPEGPLSLRTLEILRLGKG